MFCLDKEKYSTHKKVIGIAIFILFCFFMFIAYSIIEDNVEPLAYDQLRLLGLMGWGVLLVFFIVFRYITNVYITPATIFVLSMFAFSYGQILLFGLGVDYDYFFYNSYYASFYSHNLQLLLSANLYALICLCVFCFGILVSIHIKNKTECKKDITFNCSMEKTFILLFFVSFIPYLIYNIYIAFYSLSYGYSQSLELTQPVIIRYIGVFFVPSAIGAIISCEHNKRLKRFIIFCAIFNCVCAFITGGRSIAFGVMIGLIIILLMKKKKSGGIVLLLCIGAFILATISVSIADYRSSTGDQSFASTLVRNILQKNILIQFLGEAGFSGTSIVWTMDLVRLGHKTFGGITYVGAVVNLIPSTLDVFGILSYFEPYTQLEGLLTERFSFGFGVGFSLVAESYLNFKWFGFIPIFLEAIILGKLFNFEKSSSLWKQYVAIVMMTVLLSIPRRDIVFLSNQFTLCVIFPYIFIKIRECVFHSRSIGKGEI